MLRISLTTVLALALTPALHAQAFTVNTADVPNNSAAEGRTEQVDFADVDLDGDWDALFAMGGDGGVDQNRIWINQGGLQGGVIGVFAEETATRMPPILDQSRDVELADIDADGDLDLYVGNTAQIDSNGTDRFQINAGGGDGGALGFFVDETASRWVGVGAAGSSVAPSLVLPTGGFIDWVSDGEFADFDDDGDLDLFKSAVGGAMSGNVPCRIFLNDGNGFFEEFNPGGGQLTTSNIQTGMPAIWAEGVQQQNTEDTTGAFADVAGVSVDSDIGDIDGDLDLDILMGDRQAPPRLFTNRLSDGSFIFRDTTEANFLSNYSNGGGNYEQEFGDIDNDGDLDIYGLNWNGFNDWVMENDGPGIYPGPSPPLTASGPDDEEADFIDFDNDGDLDVFVGNFSGSDKLYRNDLIAGEWDLVLEAFGPNDGLASGTTRDIEVADLNGDGDYDAISTDNGVGGANEYYENLTQVPDAHAASIPRYDVLGDVSASTAPRRVRAQVYDNAPYYVTWYNDTTLDVTVDGKSVDRFPMASSGGQIFRGELPGNLVGEVCYHVESIDEYGNAGASSSATYTGTGTTGTFEGDTSDGPLGPPVLRALSAPFPESTLYLLVENLSPGVLAFVAFSTETVIPVDLGNGIVVNLRAPFLIVLDAVTDASGCAVFPVPVPPGTQGAEIAMQAIAADGVAGATWASSQALVLTVQ